MEEKKFQEALREFAEQELAIKSRAAKVHADVNQTYGNEEELPYSYHLDRVAEAVKKFGYSIIWEKDDVLPVLFGAYFHDSIEDARLTYHDVMKIASVFMTKEQAYHATEIVYALTNEKGRNRHERANDKYYDGIRYIPYAPLVKACDRYANYSYAKETASRMEKCYRDEMKEFLEKLTPATLDVRFSIPQELKDALSA